MDLEFKKKQSVLTKYHIDPDTKKPTSVPVIEKQQVHPLKNLIQMVGEVKKNKKIQIIDRDMIPVNKPEKITQPYHYYVDYEQNLIHFHPDVAGQTIEYKYEDMGVTVISANKIFTKQDEKGNVIELLEDIIRLGREAIDVMETIGGVAIVMKRLEDDIKEGYEVSQQIQDDIQQAKDEVINVQSNKEVIIKASEWILNGDGYEKEITHTCNSENLHVTAKNSDTKEATTIGYKILDKTRILLKSDEPINMSVILSASYYHATQTISDDIAEEVVKARKGEASLDVKITKMGEQLDNIENNKSNKDEVEVALNNKISKQETIDLLSNIGTMSPKGVYSNLTALKEDKPNGDTGIYLTDDNDSWNYWNGSDWIIGGVYQKTVIDDNSLTVEKIKTPLQYGIITHGTFNIDTSNGTITPMLESGMSVFVMTVPTRGVVTMELTNNSPIHISISSSRINLIYYDITSKTLKVDTQPTTILNYSSNLIFLGAFFNKVFYGELNKNKFKINDYYQQDNNLGYIFNGFINYDTSTNTLSIEGNRYFTGNAWIYTTNTKNIELTDTKSVTIDNTNTIRHIFYNLQTNSLLIQDRNDMPRDNKNKLYICSVYNNNILNGVNNDAYKINGIEINKHSYGTGSVVLGSININTVDKKLEFTNCGFGFYIASSLGQFNYSSNADDIPDVPIEIDNNRFNTIFYDTETNTFTVSVFRTKKTQLAVCTFFNNKIVYGDSKNITINNFGPIYSSILTNKKIVCIGDSMTRGYTLPIEKSWVNLIGMRNGSSTINMGISGCCMTATKSPGATVEQSIIKRLSLINIDADYILVYGGYNDAFLNVPLGNKDSENETEFYGALNLIIEYLQTNFPTAKIGFITPYKFQDKFQTYIDAIVEKCEENNIPVLKNHLVGGINYKNPKHVEVLTMGDVHLSEIGLEKASYTIENFVKSI